MKQTTNQTTRQFRPMRGQAPRRVAALRPALALLALFCCHAAASAQSSPTGPAGGDLSGTYPNPTLASDRVKTAGDTMTGALDITLPHAGTVVTPFRLAATGTFAAGRGLALEFRVPTGGASAAGGQITSAWDSTGKTYLGFSAYNGSAVSEVLRVSGSGNVGIGTTAPIAKLQIGQTSAAVSAFANGVLHGQYLSYNSGGGYTGGITLENTYTSGPATGAGVVMQSNDGAPLAAGDRLGFSVFGGAVSSSAVVNSAAVAAYADGPWAVGDAPARLEFELAPAGSTTRAKVLTMKSSGNVGVGTTSPAYRLDVQGGAVNASGGLCIAGACKDSWAEVNQWATSGAGISFSGGPVGLGTAAPSSGLEVQTAHAPLTLSQAGVAAKVTLQASSGTNLQLSANAKYTGVWDRFDAAAPSWNIVLAPTADFMGVRRAAPGGAFAWADLLRITSDGKVGINTVPTATSTEKLQVAGDVKMTGDLNVTGVITGGSIEAKYQDVAEWVPSSQRLTAGTVVTLDPAETNHVLASSRAYDTSVAGVVSPQPGIALGEKGEGKVLVATTGRVKVKVDATRGPVKVGDLLVTSDVAGVAMKSHPIDLGGTQIHRPGTIIGKALEPLEKGSGEILVLLSLQ